MGLGNPRQETDADRAVEFEYRYDNSAVGDMNMKELDTLAAKNEMRIRDLLNWKEDVRENVVTYREILNAEKEAFETKEHFKDNSLAYPTYGRGLTPNMNMDTFMIQEGMTGQVKKKSVPGESLELSPQVSVQALQRKKILSPKRQKFENQFESHMNERYVEKPTREVPDALKQMEHPPPFETVTRYEGSKNATVQQRTEVKQFMEQRKKVQGIARSLGIIESEAMQLVEGETVVNMTNDMIDNLRRVFQASKFKGEQHLDSVELLEFTYNLCADPYLSNRFDVVVRETTDQDRETLENLLERVEKEHKEERITWEQFMVNFTRRGKLRPDETIVYSGFAISDIDTARAETERYQDEDPDDIRHRLRRTLKEKLVHKQNLVPKGGKGKYNVTVPEPFFNKKKRGQLAKTKSIRAEWLENEVKQKQKQEEAMLKH